MATKRSSYYEGSNHVVYARDRRSRGVPGGAVAAIGLVMLVVGLCIGLGVAHWQAKKKGLSLFAYQRQDKEWWSTPFPNGERLEKWRAFNDTIISISKKCI